MPHGEGVFPFGICLDNGAKDQGASEGKQQQRMGQRERIKKKDEGDAEKGGGGAQVTETGQPTQFCQGVRDHKDNLATEWVLGGKRRGGKMEGRREKKNSKKSSR